MEKTPDLRPASATSFRRGRPAPAWFARVGAAVGAAWKSGRFGVLMSLIWVLALVIAYPLIETLHMGLTPPRLALAVAGDVAFGAFVLWLVIWERWLVVPAPRRRWAALAALLAIAVGLMVNDPDPLHWVGLFFSIAGVAAWLLSAREAMRAVAVILAVFLGSAVAFSFNLRLTALFFLFLLLLSVSMMNRRRLELTNRELRAAREELVQLAVAEERLRFARDLHDLLGHSLSLMVLKSELAGRLLPAAPEQAAREIVDVEGAARRALREVREAVAGYRQPTLESEMAGARAMLAAAGVACEIDRATGLLPAALDATLAWAVREGVTNVIRHSGARNCTIRAARKGDTVTVEVCDDGAGGQAAPNGAGSGLAGLTERVTARGGEVTAGPLPTGGYGLRVALPVAAA